jgi:signal transduction protein with GAF and PtsI domain
MPTLDWVLIGTSILTLILALAALRIYRDARESAILSSELLHSVASSIAERAEVSEADVFALGRDGMLRILASTRKPAAAERGIRIPLGTGVAGQAWLNRQAVFADIAPEKSTSDWRLSATSHDLIQRMHSILAVPILDRRGRTIGVLSLSSQLPLKESRFMDKRKLELAYGAADVLSNLMTAPKRSDLDVFLSSVRRPTE